MDRSNNEIGIIGCLLIDPHRTIFAASEAGVSESWFSDPQLGHLFRYAEELHSEGSPIDFVSVENKAKIDTPRMQEFANQTLIECVDKTPTVEHVGYYIEELKKEHLRRYGKHFSESLARDIATASDPTDCLVSSAKELLDVTSDRVVQNKETLEESIIGRWEAASRGEVAGIPSPWRSFNRRFGGLHRGCVTLFAGRGGKGKSSAVANWAYYLAQERIPIAWLPIEDGLDRTYARVAGLHGDFSTFQRDTGASTEADLRLSREALKYVLNLPIHMNDKHMTVNQICAWTIQMVARYGIKALFIDAFKDILRRSRDLSEDEGISQAICGLARRVDIPILVSHHVRKSGTDASNTDKLTEQDIRGSGQIANDARQIIALQNGVDIYGRESFDFEILKNNYGPTGTFKMERVSNRNRWVEPRLPDIDFEGQVR